MSLRSEKEHKRNVSKVLDPVSQLSCKVSITVCPQLFP